MFGHDPNQVRSRYDYYYSVSTPSLSQATSYYETQASLFGESVPGLLPAPHRRSPSPSRILTPLTPFNTHNASTPSSATTNYASPRPLIESFDNHLYESLRRNFIDKHSSDYTDSFNRHEIWSTHNHSSSISPRDENESDDFDSRRRAKTAFSRYKSEGNLLQNKYRSSMSAHGSSNFLHHQPQDSIEIASSDTTETIKPSTIFYLNNKPDNIIRLETTSNSASSCSKAPPSKFLRSATQSRIPLRRKTSLTLTRPPAKKPAISAMKPPVSRTIKSQCCKTKSKPPLPPPVRLVKSKSDMHSIKAHPDSFTILPKSKQPQRSPSALGFDNKKRRKTLTSSRLHDDDDESMVDMDWVKPPPEKLYEIAAVRKEKEILKCEDIEDENEKQDEDMGNEDYIIDQFGQRVSMPTTPIITDRVTTGSKNRVPDGSFNSHKKIAFAVINDYKSRKTRLLQRRYTSDDDLTGRMSPYSRYVMQRELSMPSLNRLESMEMESDDGEFFYVLDDKYDDEGGRQTSIGFVHRKPMSASMSNLTIERRPQSELRRRPAHYVSTPNFIKINKRAVMKSVPIEKLTPRVILHRSLRGVLKVYNNTNINTTKRQFSLDNMDIFLPSGRVDPDLLAPMPIRKNDKRSYMLEKQQEKYRKSREAMMRKRRLSPIEGTPHKTPNLEPLTPRKKPQTPKERLEARLKKDKFGRLLTPKKAALPDWRNRKKKKQVEEEKIEEIRLPEDPNDKKKDEEDLSKAMNFLAEIQAKNVLGRTFRAKLDARKKNPPPLVKQGSKLSIDSLGTGDKPQLKKKSSIGSIHSIKSLTTSFKSVKSFKSMLSSGPSAEDEEAEKGDEIGKLESLRGSAKGKSSFFKKAKGIGLTGRLGSASSKKESSVPPPSRSTSKLSLLSRSDSRVHLKDEETPKQSEPIRAPSVSSIMSMTTAAISSNPLNTTLIITNQLSTGGEGSRQPSSTNVKQSPEVTREDIAAIASHPDADKTSLASQHTSVSISSKTSGKGSRKTSGRSSRNTSAEPRRRSIMSAVNPIRAINLFKRRGSKGSDGSEKSDEQLTTGPGSGADNKDSVVAAANSRILQQSQSKTSLNSMNKTAERPPSQSSQARSTAADSSANMKTLEKKSSKKSLMEQDSNNNNVAKMSRTNTLTDMGAAGTTTTTSTTRMESVTHMSSASKSTRGDQMSVNAITVAPDSRSTLQNQESNDSNHSNSSTSSSMAEMTRKRKLCCGLSACCNRAESMDALSKIAKKTTERELTFKEKISNCACWPFRICKRQKVADGKTTMKSSMMEPKPSFWKRLCSCGSCCSCCKKSDDGMKSSMMEKESCWSRLNCFKSCSSCCSNLKCSSCCRPKDSDPYPTVRDNDTPGTCTRIFCFCCLCCRGKPESEQQHTLKRPSEISQRGNCCSRMCNALFCCCRRKTKENRRRSMLSKKQSLAPTIPPPEEQKPKLDMVLVEHASLMKGAIPVIPIYLAYFCLVCNILLPGVGTILSGLFCLCIGIPRFSQHDGARGRIGSFIINLIVGVSQAFTIIFCFVGWGWSIWWGTIMVNLAKKRRRIRKAERLREEDEYMRQKEELPGIGRHKMKDAEKGII